VGAAVLPADRLQVHLDLSNDDAEDERVGTMLPHGPAWHARQRALAAAVAPWAAGE
jgi:hypothetical protein